MHENEGLKCTQFKQHLEVVIGIDQSCAFSVSFARQEGGGGHSVNSPDDSVLNFGRWHFGLTICSEMEGMTGIVTSALNAYPVFFS